ncbi:uncharacterized protein LOC108718308 isoform X2 [Xenopus laevis]|uniref:Uncharacterized protein LOC108718308 isoform X2 n=2 Tax=Xenopus laevis TaxID=8355 RepID=A0A1L8G5D7_XENLA|nr:uncharacterized protein LOC108718308 isoform X2 [Xenopus laevis]OCT79139.1 hypothetical protein XELAEV_18030237mg [Xenopus laevis]
MDESRPESEADQSVPGDSSPATESNVTEAEEEEAEEEEEEGESGSSGTRRNSTDRTDPLLILPAQSEGTHEGQIRQTSCLLTRFNRYRQIFFHNWKIISILAGVIFCLVVVISVAVHFSSTNNIGNGNTTTNISRELSPNSSLLTVDLYWKPCHGINLNISNQGLSWKGSQDYCAKFHARLLHSNFIKTIEDCIMDNDDYWIGQDCNLTQTDSNCNTYSKEFGFVPLHFSTERLFICTK